jgi:hypothetical protein
MSLSVRLYQLGSNCTDFREMWYWWLSLQCVEKMQIWLQSEILHEDVSTFYCCWWHQIAIRRCFPMKWYQAVRMVEEVRTLRERAAVLWYVYVSHLVYQYTRIACFYGHVVPNRQFCFFQLVTVERISLRLFVVCWPGSVFPFVVLILFAHSSWRLALKH